MRQAPQLEVDGGADRARVHRCPGWRCFRGGATGNVGRPLTASLVGAGHAVTAVARGTSADLPGGPGIIPAAADLTDPVAARSLAVSMAGAEALFLLVPGAGAGMDAAALLETARAQGVRRVVQHLAFFEVSHDDAREQMLQSMPALVADATLAILGRPTQEEGQVSPDVEEVLGRPGHSFADWAQRNATAFR